MLLKLLYLSVPKWCAHDPTRPHLNVFFPFADVIEVRFEAFCAFVFKNMQPPLFVFIEGWLSWNDATNARIETTLANQIV